MRTETAFVTLVHIECYKCHCIFGISQDHERRAREDSDICFYCPNGHEQCYCTTELTRLQHKLDQMEGAKETQRKRAERAEENARHQKRRAATYKGQATKVKNRVKHGVCPCCQRTFKQLAAHMKRMHPDYVEDK